MNYIPPLAKQLIVASSPQLASLSVGGVIGYPAVIINQLKSNDSTIILDEDTSSWIASVQGLAGISSILIPTIMQWQGRRFAFVVACLSTVIGWFLASFASNAITIIIAESLHGFGGNSLIAVSMITVSEMMDPKFRSISMVMVGFNQTLGLVLVTLFGYFFNWQTVGIIMGIPILIALIPVFAWPESPSWLACKGKFEECEKAFIILRGTDNEAIKELNELIIAQKESLQKITLKQSLQKSKFRNILLKISRKDFFMPIIHATIIIFTFYFMGSLVIITYAVDIIASSTKNTDFICFLFIDGVILSSTIFSIIFIKYFNKKPIVIVSLLGSGIFLIISSIIMYCDNFFPEQALLICVLGFMFFSTFGASNLSFVIAAELIPVKHRGVGGALCIIESCIFHTGSIKISLYFMKSIGMSAIFLIFGFVALTGLLLFWIFIPETKNKTLQEIEDFYNDGRFGDRK